MSDFHSNINAIGDFIDHLTAERDQLRAELEKAKEQLEFDRTTCHTFITALDKALDGRFWLTEGRGSYSWDDDRYRDEFRDAAVALREILDPMRKMALSLASRLPTTEAVMNARVDLKASAEAAEAHVADLRGALEPLLSKFYSLCGLFGPGTSALYYDELQAAHAALATTPATSARRLRAEVLRWVADELLPRHMEGQAAECVRAEADRIESEVG